MRRVRATMAANARSRAPALPDTRPVANGPMRQRCAADVPRTRPEAKPGPPTCTMKTAVLWMRGADLPSHMWDAAFERSR